MLELIEHWIFSSLVTDWLVMNVETLVWENDDISIWETLNIVCNL